MRIGKGIITAGTAIAVAIASTMYWQHTKETAAIARKAELARQAAALHGHGKKPLSCDMSLLTIRHGSSEKVIPVADFINLDAKGLIHDKARRMFHYKVRPMTLLLDEYPDTDSVTFVSCDDDSTLTLAAETIRQDPLNHVLSINNRGRARLATYELTSKRAKYHTMVRNIVRIELNWFTQAD